MIEQYVDSQELKRLLRTLLVVVGALSVAGLFASIVVPGLRNANRPAPPPAQDAVGGEWGWLDPNAFPPQRGYEIPPLDPNIVLKPDADTLKGGQALYAKNCEQCHGSAGHGDGPAGIAIRPQPRNFTQDQGWKNGPGVAAIFKTLSEGIPKSSMASFTFLRPKDRVALAHYVQSLQRFARKEDGAALAALAQELARSGGHVPNRIPVALAMDKLEGEAARPRPLATPALEDDGAGAVLFRRAVRDPQRAQATLRQVPDWRQSLASFERAVAREAPINGFTVGVTSFDPVEWQALQAELIRRGGE